MSQDNVELVRRVFELINRGDVDAALEVAADDVEMDWSNSIGPAKGVYRGKDEVRALWASFVEAFEDLHWEPEEIIEVGESTVIAVNHMRTHGRESGVEVDAVGAQLWTITGGTARRVKLYQSKADALEAVGLGD